VRSSYDAYNQPNRKNYEFQIKSYVAEKNGSFILKPNAWSVLDIPGNSIVNKALST
jgi:hypothetical protein